MPENSVAKTSKVQSAGIPVHRTKGELAYIYLREQILSGTLRPGQRLTLTALSKLLNTSQMPVRDALVRLEQEGLIRITPHTDIHVIKLEPRDALELFQIRAALEGLAARLACGSDRKALVAELRSANNRFAMAFDRENYAEMAEANWTFHRAILHAADNLHLVRQTEDIWGRCFRFRLGYQLIPGRAKATIVEHTAIVDSMAAGNVEACVKAAVAHVEQAGRDLLVVVQSGEG